MSKRARLSGVRHVCLLPSDTMSLVLGMVDCFDLLHTRHVCRTLAKLVKNFLVATTKLQLAHNDSFPVNRKDTSRVPGRWEATGGLGAMLWLIQQAANLKQLNLYALPFVKEHSQVYASSIVMAIKRNVRTLQNIDLPEDFACLSSEADCTSVVCALGHCSKLTTLKPLSCLERVEDEQKVLELSTQLIARCPYAQVLSLAISPFVLSLTSLRSIFQTAVDARLPLTDLRDCPFPLLVAAKPLPFPKLRSVCLEVTGADMCARAVVHLSLTLPRLRSVTIRDRLYDEEIGTVECASVWHFPNLKNLSVPFFPRKAMLSAPLLTCLELEHVHLEDLQLVMTGCPLLERIVVNSRVAPAASVASAASAHGPSLKLDLLQLLIIMIAPISFFTWLVASGSLPSLTVAHFAHLDADSRQGEDQMSCVRRLMTVAPNLSRLFFELAWPHEDDLDEREKRKKGVVDGLCSTTTVAVCPWLTKLELANVPLKQLHGIACPHLQNCTIRTDEMADVDDGNVLLTLLATIKVSFALPLSELAGNTLARAVYNVPRPLPMVRSCLFLGVVEGIEGIMGLLTTFCNLERLNLKACRRGDITALLKSVATSMQPSLRNLTLPNVEFNKSTQKALARLIKAAEGQLTRLCFPAAQPKRIQLLIKPSVDKMRTRGCKVLLRAKRKPA